MKRDIHIFPKRSLTLLLVCCALTYLCSCGSCGSDKPKNQEKKTQKKRKPRKPSVDTLEIDSLLGDSLLEDSLLTDSLLTDSLETLADSLQADEFADSLLEDELMTEEQFAVKNFVEVKAVIPDLIQEIRYFTDHNFVGRRIEGYQDSVALMTREGAEALKKAADELREKGYRIKIYDAYRPDDAVQHFRRWVGDMKDQKMKDEFYPEVDKETLFKQGYISSRSKHCHGSTVDMTLCDLDGNDIDMGGHFDFFSETSHSNYTETLTEEQKNNRAILRTAMENNGFKIAGTEWWHFSLINEPYPETSFNFPVKRLENMIPKKKQEQPAREKKDKEKRKKESTGKDTSKQKKSQKEKAKKQPK